MHGGADVTEHRAGSAGHDRRQPPPLARQHRPTDGVHAAVRHAQPATRNPTNATNHRKDSHPSMPLAANRRQAKADDEREKQCRRGRVQSPPPAWTPSGRRQLHAPSAPGSANDGSVLAAMVAAGTANGAEAL
jgi:hypothetical protein